MSRIGRLPITVPTGVKVDVAGQKVTISGPKGELSLVVADPIGVAIDEGKVLVKRKTEDRFARSLHGLTRTLISNNVIGVTAGYSKSLEVVGTGYRVAQKGAGIELSLGFSHSVPVEPLSGITLIVEGNNKIHVSGINKQQVGEMAANIRKLKKPEPYKGKGIRYAGEVVRRKAGKAGK